MDKNKLSIEELRQAWIKEKQTSFRYFLIAALLSFPFFFQMLAMGLGYSFPLSSDLQLLLATMVQIGCGWQFYRSSYYALRALKGNMDLLVALGTTAAYGFSLAVYFLHMPQPLYFESSAIILTLTLFGRWLEALTKEGAFAALEALIHLQPNRLSLEKESFAHLLKEGFVQKLADQASAIFIPIILGISLFTYLVWSLGIEQPASGFINAIGVLIIACPCMLGVALPLVILMANSTGAQLGIFFRQAAAMEQAARMNLLFLGSFHEITSAAIQQLKARHVTPILFTNSQQENTLSLATQAGIEEIKTALETGEKVQAIQQAKQSGAIVGMAGYSGSDVPALMEAHVSFAMGMESNMLKEAANISLMRHDLSSLAAAIDLSRQTMRKMKQNLFLAFIYNLLTIPLAAAGLLNPLIVAGTMAVSFVSVIANALLLRYWRPKSVIFSN
ncbi:hypothetical protein [Candidatus Protochlamydia phocaeensis]|uniref:P-type ATPase n=1 Tax=Candidatus Protochlamydia phocaeensis TaxID=1414722 RepID=UPI000837AA3C|nr:hypothetical protein [Candidatus Protochlamydia phocaeensis]